MNDTVLQQVSELLDEFLDHCGDVCPDSSRFSDEGGLADRTYELQLIIEGWLKPSIIVVAQDLSDEWKKSIQAYVKGVR